MKEFGKILYSNKSILKNKGVNIFIIFLLFFINIALITSPLFTTRANIDPADILDRLDGLEEAFVEIYDLELDCDITDLTCDLPETANGYEIVINQEPTSEKFILFGDNLVIQSGDFLITGTYEFLEGFTWNPTNYRESSVAIIYAISSSTVGRDYFLMYTGQFIQNGIYLMAISAMIMIANYKQPKRKITYTEAVKVSIMAMLGPALLAALAGAIFSSIATLIFMTIYAIRMMYLYYAILKN